MQTNFISRELLLLAAVKSELEPASGTDISVGVPSCTSGVDYLFILSRPLLGTFACSHVTTNR